MKYKNTEYSFQEKLWGKDKRGHKNKLTRGAFGVAHIEGQYTTLKVLPTSKRTKDNCNQCGVQL